ncbi:MAG: Flp pilus assembly complex ATPase component TadA [Bradymonadaceae bacterium]|nr:Flp pilus assembly complex ATPase component TadA [Lujinxingiaceae bacterium]
MSDAVEVDAKKENEWYKQRGIKEARLIKAFKAVPRDVFTAATPATEGSEASQSQSLPPAEVVAKLVSALKLKANHKVLEIGTDSGYIAAILSHLADQIYTIERRLPVAKLAQGRLAGLERGNVDVLHGTRLTEYVLNAPYDAILLSAVAPRVPEKLQKRLSIGGRLVVPIAQTGKNPEIMCITRTAEDSFSEESLGQLRFTALLGHILVEMGVADSEDIELAAMEADANGKRLGQTLVDSARIKESDLVRALAIQRGFKLAEVGELVDMADHELAFSVPRAFLKHHRVLPIRLDGKKLIVATVDPDAPAIELARILDASAVEIYITTNADFERLWTTLLEGRRPLQLHEDNLKVRVENKFEAMLRAAVRVQARAIHLETTSARTGVRFRLERELREVSEVSFDGTEMAFLLEYLKINARLDVEEQRVPQRGRFSWARDTTTFHIGLQTLPSILGDQIVLNILASGDEPATLKSLGFADDLVDEMRVILQLGTGLVLIVGPAQVGKSTTLYAMLHEIAQDRTKKVALIEDDVLYPIPGVHQALVQPDRGFGFSEALREFARCDVDVIAISQISDAKTAMQAIEAAHKGLLVIATLQGKSAVQVLAGLRDLGVPADVLAGALTAVLTQRLAPRICEVCRTPAKPDPKFIDKIFPRGEPVGFKAYVGKGCAHCNKRGTHGRAAIVEWLPVSDAMRHAIATNRSAEELRLSALDSGVTTLAQWAVRMTREGIIPVDELDAYLPVKHQ